MRIRKMSLTATVFVVGLLSIIRAQNQQAVSINLSVQTMRLDGQTIRAGLPTTKVLIGKTSALKAAVAPGHCAPPKSPTVRSEIPSWDVSVTPVKVTSEGAQMRMQWRPTGQTQWTRDVVSTFASGRSTVLQVVSGESCGAFTVSLVIEVEAPALDDIYEVEAVLIKQVAGVDEQLQKQVGRVRVRGVNEIYFDGVPSGKGDQSALALIVANVSAQAAKNSATFKVDLQRVDVLPNSSRQGAGSSGFELVPGRVGRFAVPRSERDGAVRFFVKVAVAKVKLLPQ